jgi:hypothetical protein
LVSLDLSRALLQSTHPPKVTDQALSLKLSDVLACLKASAGSLRRVRISFLWLRYPEEPGWTPEWSHATLELEDTCKLARAAPLATLESDLCAVVTDESFDTESGEDNEPSQHVASSVDTLCALFRHTAPVANVRLRSVNFSSFCFQRRGPVTHTQAFVNFCAAMAQHTSLTDIRLYGGMGGGGNVTMDDGGAGLEAFVDAAVALPALGLVLHAHAAGAAAGAGTPAARGRRRRFDGVHV